MPILKTQLRLLFFENRYCDCKGAILSMAKSWELDCSIEPTSLSGLKDDFGSVSMETVADTVGRLFVVAIMFAFGRNLYNILMNSISNVGSSIWAAFEGFGREIRKAGQWVGVLSGS